MIAQLRQIHFLAFTVSQTLLTFFLWGFMKDEVYMWHMLLTVNKFKDQIGRTVPNIEQSLLREISIIWKCAEHKMELYWSCIQYENSFWVPLYNGLYLIFVWRPPFLLINICNCPNNLQSLCMLSEWPWCGGCNKLISNNENSLQQKDIK